jgi:hypothetical protein
VHADLDTLVTALYVTIDDLFGPRTGPGRPVGYVNLDVVCELRVRTRPGSI